jgi:hypothetical protein
MKKKTSLFLSLFLLVVVPALAQDPVKRPDNVGVSDFDSFKNTAFDSQDESIKLNADTKKIDSEIKGYAGALSAVSVPKLKEDLAALRGINKSQKALREKLGTLDEKGKTLLGSAKDVTPKLKSLPASNNTKKSISALEAARKNLDGVSGLLADNSKLLIGELKARGETVEVFD